MLNHALEAAFAALFQNTPAWKSVHVFTGHESEEHALPSITVTSKSEPLAGSGEVFRADLSLLVESEAHDSKPERHAALVERVRAPLGDKAAVFAAIQTGERVCLYGYVFTGSTLEVEGTRFRTTLTLKVGYGKAG